MRIGNQEFLQLVRLFNREIVFIKSNKVVLKIIFTNSCNCFDFGFFQKAFLPKTDILAFEGNIFKAFKFFPDIGIIFKK